MEFVSSATLASANDFGRVGLVTFWPHWKSQICSQKTTSSSFLVSRGVTIYFFMLAPGLELHFWALSDHLHRVSWPGLVTFLGTLFRQIWSIFELLKLGEYWFAVDKFLICCLDTYELALCQFSARYVTESLPSWAVPLTVESVKLVGVFRKKVTRPEYYLKFKRYIVFWSIL